MAFNPKLRWQVYYLQYRLNKFFKYYKMGLKLRQDGKLGPATRRAIRVAKLAMGYVPKYATYDRTDGFYNNLLKYGRRMTSQQRARGLAYRKKWRSEHNDPSPGSYPNLRGDLDASHEVMSRADKLARARGEVWYVTSGGRSYAEQLALWNSRFSNPYPVARPGTSRHETRRAMDIIVNGRAIQNVVSSSQLRQYGLYALPGDAVHIELM